MTTNESFKRQVRERMARTGERYAAARHHLIAAASSSATQDNGWVSEPDVADDRLRENTGHGWDDWVALIDTGPGRAATHARIAAWVVEHHDVSGWWAQTVTVGYERITGIRLPGQMPDGTFTVSRSKVLSLGIASLRARLFDDGGPDTLVPGLSLTSRSRAGVRRPRFTVTEEAPDGALGQGVLMLSIDDVGGRSRLTVTHERIASAAEAEQWKKFWAEWLTTLADAA